MRQRTIWFECSHSHRRAIPGKLLHTREGFTKLLTRIQKLHANLYPTCRAEWIRVAATQDAIRTNRGAATFRIDHSQRLILPAGGLVPPQGIVLP